MQRRIFIVVLIVFLVVTFFTLTVSKKNPLTKNTDSTQPLTPAEQKWKIPDTSELKNLPNGELIEYGRNIIMHTSVYFGPKGKISRITNGMNCDNCHLQAGTKFLGNNFSLASTGFPRFKERSGSEETLIKKVQDCFERSLNGTPIDSNSREMKAIVAYMMWIGKYVQKGQKPEGFGLENLPFLNRPADTIKGKTIFISKCRKCHGNNGQGKLDSTGLEYTYPPLWGEHSYNIGASIYRISKFAGFVKNNMPFGTTYESRQLTTDEAWDVAAFVNSQPHPYKDLSNDWPGLNTKPFDHPFGPYADTLFSPAQRKYGPFAPIKNYYSALNKNSPQ